MKNGVLAISLGIGMALGATAVLAHKGATGVVKERMEMMKEMAQAMKAVAPIMKGEAEYDASVVAKAASDIARYANHIPASFPEGTTGHPSEASAKIWSDWDRFEASAEELRQQAAALEAAARTGPEEAKVQFGKLAASCKGCHQDFRVKKD